MAIIKKFRLFESDESSSEDIQDLLYSLKRLNILLKDTIRFNAPKELIEDAFLVLLDDGWKVTGNDLAGHQFTKSINLHYLCKESEAESFFKKSIDELIKCRTRLETKWNFQCHFLIKCNGRLQQAGIRKHIKLISIDGKVLVRREK